MKSVMLHRELLLLTIWKELIMNLYPITMNSIIYHATLSSMLQVILSTSSKNTNSRFSPLLCSMFVCMHCSVTCKFLFQLRDFHSHKRWPGKMFLFSFCFNGEIVNEFCCKKPETLSWINDFVLFQRNYCWI